MGLQLTVKDQLEPMAHKVGGTLLDQFLKQRRHYAARRLRDVKAPCPWGSGSRYKKRGERMNADRQAAENLCVQAKEACPVYKSAYACGAACADSRTQPRNRAAPGEAPAAAD